MESYKDFAISLAREAGDLMRSNFVLGMKKEWKPGNEPVTVTDLAINKLVISRVKKNYPSHGVLSEEESDYKESDEFIWVCDPIDGTQPFSRGMPTSTFSLALTTNGTVVLGVVYDPFLDRMFFAQKGMGATLNNEPIHVSEESVFERSMIATEALKNFNLNSLYSILPTTGVQYIRLASIIYTGMLVACGQLEGVMFGGKRPWDVATMKIIIEEAGGKVTDIYGNDQRYDRETKGCIASSPKIYPHLLELVKEHSE